MYQSFKIGLGGYALAKHGRKPCKINAEIHMEKKVKGERNDDEPSGTVRKEVPARY